MIDKDKQPGIKFHDVILAKETFERIPEFPEQIDLDIGFEFSISSANDDYYGELITSVRCLSESGQEVLTMKCTHVGVFSVIEGEENMSIQDFMENNAAALMFPFVREHIYSTTKKACISPIALPPINIRAMIKDQKNSDNQANN